MKKWLLFIYIRSIHIGFITHGITHFWDNNSFSMNLWLMHFPFNSYLRNMRGFYVLSYYWLLFSYYLLIWWLDITYFLSWLFMLHIGSLIRFCPWLNKRFILHNFFLRNHHLNILPSGLHVRRILNLFPVHGLLIVGSLYSLRFIGYLQYLICKLYSLFCI